MDDVKPRSVYDEAKRYGEALLMAFHRAKGLEIRLVRIFNTYGPRMRGDDGRVIPTFINQALNRKPLTVFGSGEQTRSFCYVDDLICGFTMLMESDFTGPCNLGNPHELNMLKLAEEINHLTNNSAGIVHRPLPQDDPTRRKPDISLAKQRLNWTPQVSFDKGIQQTIKYFVEAQK